MGEESTAYLRHVHKPGAILYTIRVRVLLTLFRAYHVKSTEYRTPNNTE